MGNDVPVAQREDRSTAVQSVDRAITVLEILARDGDVSVTELALELGVHKSTASRLLSALEGRAMVEQVVDRGKYRLGFGILRLAGATSARIDVVAASRPIAESLAAQTGETINLAILNDRDALYVDQVAGNSALQLRNWLGRRIPVHCTANGRVLVAWLDHASRWTVIGEQPYRFTNDTITDPAVLDVHLDEVRTRGWAHAIDELEPGLFAVAAPVRDASGHVVASMSLSGPSMRLSPIGVEHLGSTVAKAADEVSIRMGWHAPTSAPRVTTLRRSGLGT